MEYFTKTILRCEENRLSSQLLFGNPEASEDIRFAYPDVTAAWETVFNAMIEGRVRLADFMNLQKKFVAALCITAGASRFKAVKRTGPDCPKCDQGTLSMRTGKRGKFWGCSRYPECKTTFDDRKGAPAIK